MVPGVFEGGDCCRWEKKMKILLVDTSGPVCGVAIAADGDLVYEAFMKNKMTHSQKVMPMVEDALMRSDLGLSDLDAFAAVVGPGSFTGVRIGVATVKGLAEACGKPCIAVDALEALAENGRYFEGIVCPILDARAGQVYGAAFRPGDRVERLAMDEALKLTEFLDRIEAFGGPYLFVGDGIGVHRAAIEERLGTACRFHSPAMAALRPGCAALLAMQKLQEGKQVSPEALLPLYLRAPQAERERLAKAARSRVETSGV